MRKFSFRLTSCLCVILLLTGCTSDNEMQPTLSKVIDVNRQVELQEFNRIQPVINTENIFLSQEEAELEYEQLREEHKIKYAVEEDEETSDDNYNILYENYSYTNLFNNINYITSSSIESITSQQERLKDIVASLINTPYVWGGTTTSGMDCSGFSQYVMSMLGYSIPRVSYNQSEYGQLVSRTQLRVGDLLFFDTTNPRDPSDIKTPTEEMLQAYLMEEDYVPNTVSHVGIYMGNGIMAHASSGDGKIVYTDLNLSYYKNRFINARRIIQ